MLMHSAFGCVSLRKSTLIVGCASTVKDIYHGLYSYILYSRSREKADDDYDQELLFGISDTAYFAFDTSVIFLDIIVLACLLYGTYKGRPFFLIPYIVLFSAELFLMVVIEGYGVAVVGTAVLIAPEIIMIAFISYFLCIVTSYFLQLRSTQTQTCGPQQGLVSFQSILYMAVMESAFCCATLKTGTLIIAWLRLMWTLVTQGIYAALEGTDELSFLERYLFVKGLILSNITIVSLVIVALIALLYGTYRSRPIFLLPYMLIALVEIIKYSYDTISMLWLTAVDKDDNGFVIFGFIGLAFISILSYFLCVVISFTAYLRSGTQVLKYEVAIERKDFA